MADIYSEAIALYDRYTHQGLDRRTLMSELTRIAGSAAAASTLLTAIAADPAAAAVTDEKDPRLIIRRGPIGLERGKLDGYVAAPQLGRQARKLPALLLVHENRGLNRHIEDVARRLALAGFFVVAPDFLTEFGGTPSDQDKARELMGKLDLSARVADAVEAVEMMRSLPPANGKVGAIGFCWGGAFVNRLAVAAGDKLDAAVPYYGPAPDPSEAAKVKAAMLLHYAGIDERVNVTAAPWIAALKKAGVPTEAHFYEGANHAFNNDTSAERYDKAAADLAWRRTIAFLERELA